MHWYSMRFFSGNAYQDLWDADVKDSLLVTPYPSIKTAMMLAISLPRRLTRTDAPHMKKSDTAILTPFYSFPCGKMPKKKCYRELV